MKPDKEDWFDTTLLVPTNLEMAMEQAVLDKLRKVMQFPPNIKGVQHTAKDRAEQCYLAASQGSHWCKQVLSFIMNCRVVQADFILFGKTPMQRVELRSTVKRTKMLPSDTPAFKSARVDPDNVVLDLMRKRNLMDVFNLHLADMADAIVSVLPSDRKAMLNADIRNACAAASMDQKKLAPIQARLDKMRIAERERYTAQIRNFFRKNDGLLSEKDITKIWRECIVEEIMES